VLVGIQLNEITASTFAIPSVSPRRNSISLLVSPESRDWATVSMASSMLSVQCSVGHWSRWVNACKQCHHNVREKVEGSADLVSIYLSYTPAAVSLHCKRSI